MWAIVEILEKWSELQHRQGAIACVRLFAQRAETPPPYLGILNRLTGSYLSIYCDSSVLVIKTTKNSLHNNLISLHLD